MESLPARPEFSARRRFQRSPWGRFLVAVAAVCAAVVASRVYWQRPSRPAAEIAFQSTTVKLPELSVAQVESWTTKLDEPLQKELQNVISDTRQAIHFVASNFLPEN